MKYIVILSCLLLAGCAPRTENRAHMDAQAKRMSDSLDACLDSALSDPLVEISKPGN